MRALKNVGRPQAISIVLGLLAAGSLVVGARAVTATLLASDEPPAAVGVAMPVTTTTSTTLTNESTPATTTTSVPSTTAAIGDAEQPPVPTGTLTIGEPIIDPGEPVSFQDRITVLPTMMSGSAAPTQQAPADGASGPGTRVESQDVTNDEAAPLPRAFNVGVMVKAENHFAVIRVGVDAGPEGLSKLSVDFGDGEVLQVSQGRIGQLGDIGTIEIVHRFEPTLTPQPQEVTATATDGAGTVKLASARFETQAAFLLGYSPLTVTALDDCDQFGKGDFELRWNNDGRERSSRFDLGKGDSHVEDEFRVGLDDVRYQDQIPLTIYLQELDSLGVDLLRVFSGQIGDALHAAPLDMFVDVLEFGTHTVPFTIEREIKDNCDIRLDFDVTLAIP